MNLEARQCQYKTYNRETGEREECLVIVTVTSGVKHTFCPMHRRLMTEPIIRQRYDFRAKVS